MTSAAAFGTMAMEAEESAATMTLTTAAALAKIRQGGGEATAAMAAKSTTKTTTTTMTSTRGTRSRLWTAGTLATLELQYFKAASLYRRRNYEKCAQVCNAMLQAGHENNVQMFTTPPDQEAQDEVYNNSNSNININSESFGFDVGSGYAGVGTVAGAGAGVYGAGVGAGAGGAGGVGVGGGGGGNVIGGSSHGQSRYSSNLQRIGPGPQGRRRRVVGSDDAGDGHSETGSSISNNNNNSSSNKVATVAATAAAAGAAAAIMPTWLMEGVWQLKMRALTQRVYIDDLETNDADNEANEEVEFERIATTARPGTSIKVAFVPRPSTSNRLRTSGSGGTNGQRPGTGKRSNTSQSTQSSEGRLMSASTRPMSGMMRPGTSVSRPGSAVGARPASRCGTATRVRAASAAAYTVGDATAKLYQASRLNPTIYAEREVLVKAIFQFLYYHEADTQKAYSLCEAVIEVHKHKAAQPTSGRLAADLWWWYQQMGRCLLCLQYPRKAEPYLEQSLAAFAHPDTYLLLSRLYQRLEQHERALQLINTAVDRNPFDIVYRTEQGRIYDAMSKTDDAMQIHRLISKLNPINIEALACIALNYFYENNPEMSLMYYRRILSLGFHTAELYCNIALCCLYGGQIDLVLPCFQRALVMAKTAEQKADIWYNLSFVAVTTGDFQLARRCLKLCLISDARNGAALNNLAVLAAHSGDIMNAKSYLNAAKEVLPDASEVTDNLQYMDAHYKL